jgi:NAD(P)-dependent dehydrogenase (short-subunit alcohol dehydrogenase family)
MMGQRFVDQPVLVTAAAAGIGAATARAFALEGARVVLSDINRERGVEQAQALCAEGAVAHFIAADCTDEEQVEALVRKTVETLGGLAFAANVVGDVMGDAGGPEFHAQATAGWNATIAVSLTSAYLCMKHEIRHMIEHGGGAITNVTSLAGMLHVPDSGAAYAAAKAGVIQLSKFAAVNYANRGIRVNCIAPGVTPTAAYFKGGQAAGDEVIAHLLENQPIRRAIDPGEQAAAILWLSSREAGMVTGHVLPVDGGWTAA